MNETLSSEDNPESVTHVLRQFCYLSLRLLRRAETKSRCLQSSWRHKCNTWLAPLQACAAELSWEMLN